VEIAGYTGETTELRFTNTSEFCEIMAKGDDYFYLTMSEEKIPGSNQLIFIDVNLKDNGAWYFIGDYNGQTQNKNVLLCDILKHLFGYYPENIYFYRDF
jgi:hypothetical protein